MHIDFLRHAREYQDAQLRMQNPPGYGQAWLAAQQYLQQERAFRPNIMSDRSTKFSKVPPNDKKKIVPTKV